MQVVNPDTIPGTLSLPEVIPKHRNRRKPSALPGVVQKKLNKKIKEQNMLWRDNIAAGKVCVLYAAHPESVLSISCGSPSYARTDHHEVWLSKIKQPKKQHRDKRHSTVSRLLPNMVPWTLLGVTPSAPSDIALEIKQKKTKSST